MARKHPLSAHWRTVLRSVWGLALVLMMVALSACSQMLVNVPQTPASNGSGAATTAPSDTPADTAAPTAEATDTTAAPTDTAVPTTVPTDTAAPPTETATATSTTTNIPAVQDPNTNPLTGLPASDPALLQRRVLAVRVGNDPQARPQDGLGSAEVVWEEVMDGWTVTRFTALYLESSPERVRPVRSARLSSLAIAPQYDAALVHSGASDKIRWYISQASFVNLDQFFDPKPFSILSGYDWRGRMYTSVERLHKYLKEKGLERDTLIKGYTFDPNSPSGGDPAQTIHIPYPSSSTVDWSYDATTGRYLREVQGRPHLDGLTKQQIAAQNVIILYAEHKRTNIVEDQLGATAIDIVLSGSGRAQVIRDGVVLEARWSQEGPNTLIQYYDASGKLIPLKPGQTWIQIVPLDYEVKIS